jgi:alkylation response protein AidB-like acyl-CoA dehydrogenase
MNGRVSGRAEERRHCEQFAVANPHSVNTMCSTYMHRGAKIHTIFEGTSEIQQLVISRAISGLRIE